MQVIEIQENNYTIKKIIISYRFNHFDNIVCSGSKIYQLPCKVGVKSYLLKELKQKYHLGMTVYLINSKRISAKRLKESAIKVDEQIIISKIKVCPF